jgi:uncharacterized membrane protein YfcA
VVVRCSARFWPGGGSRVAKIAPAALASTFVTSIVGVLAYSLMSFTIAGDIAPDWPVGVACGLGGLVGGYLGARLQPRMPERILRLVLGVLAVVLATLYVVEVLLMPVAG